MNVECIGEQVHLSFGKYALHGSIVLCDKVGDIGYWDFKQLGLGDYSDINHSQSSPVQLKTLHAV